MRVRDLNQFVGWLFENDFKHIGGKDYIFKKQNISVAVWGNSKNLYSGDLIIKNWTTKPETTISYNNDNDDDFEYAIATITNLLKETSCK